MRNTYLVCYDICKDKRLRQLFKTMRNYGDHLQYSVFDVQMKRNALQSCLLGSDRLSAVSGPRPH